MKILVLSDTHAYLENARAVLARLQGKVDAVFHLGDHDDDAVALQQEFPKLPFHYVKGNNDYRVDTPSQKLVRLGGKTLLLTHGHKQRADIKKIPEHLLKEEDPIFAFHEPSSTQHLLLGFTKRTLAFYESMGVKGWIAFEKTVKYIKENYPDQFIIADAKRGDIGNTSAMYARTFFDELDIDSVTVAPYMGEDSVTPFLTYEGKWVILLALTSNKGSHDFQLTEDPNGERLFEKVLRRSQER